MTRAAQTELTTTFLYFFARNGLVGVNANYRLAPQNRFPDAALDMGLVVAWIHANAADIGADSEQIFLFGHSSGGDPRRLLGV